MTGNLVTDGNERKKDSVIRKTKLPHGAIGYYSNLSQTSKSE